MKAVGSQQFAGEAYAFVRSNASWTQQAILTPSSGVGGDGFGFSIAIDADTAFVGAPGKTIGSNTQQGAAFVFVRAGTSWQQQQMLQSSDGAMGDHFGVSVAVSGDTAVVGASDKAVAGATNQGAAGLCLM